MILVGIDDTDMPETPGTNQLARALAAEVADRYPCRMILRHQLLFDPRVPYTSKNGAASIWLVPATNGTNELPTLIDALRARMLRWYVPGSDPGLCVATRVPAEVVAFGQRAQRQLVDRHEAEDLAQRHGLHLEGLGGTNGGMIGALAAVGLAALDSDGRVVAHADWPAELSGPQPLGLLTELGVDVRCLETGHLVAHGAVDVGKRLRPNWRDGRMVLYVLPGWPPADATWQAVRQT